VLRSDGDILPRKQHSGRWLVVWLFIIGGIVLAGFFASRYWFDHTPQAKWPTTRP
jgi:hypothetical protein